MSILLSVTLPCTPVLVSDPDEFSPVQQFLTITRPLHWLDIARPIYRLLSHPLTMAIVWGAVYILSALASLGWLLVVLL